MKGFKLDSIWNEEHSRAFIVLKACLISEPILSAPCYNGMPFTLTTDGCKDTFTGVLAQQMTTMLPGGKKVTRMHPITSASKQTSVSEEKYKPFLLEFAALKFSVKASGTNLSLQDQV